MTRGLEIDMDATEDVGGSLLRGLSLALALAWMLMGMFLFNAMRSGATDLAENPLLKSYSGAVRALWGLAVGLPMALMVYIGGSSLKHRVKPGEVVLQRSRYLLRPLNWWEFFPLWPAMVYAVWALIGGASRLDDVRGTTPGWMLTVTLTTAALSFVLIGTLLTASESRLEPTGIRTSTMRITEWENIERVLETPAGYLVFDRRSPVLPRVRLRLRGKPVEPIFRDAMAEQGIDIEVGRFRAPPHFLGVSLLLSLIPAAAGEVARTSLGLHPLWVTVVALVVGIPMTILFDKMRGEMKGTKTARPKNVG